MTMGLRRTLMFGTALVCLSVGIAQAGERATIPAHPALDGTLVSYTPAEQVAGLMTIAGSDTMQPIVVRIAQEFRRWHPEAKIIVQGESMGIGARSLLDSLVDGIAGMRQGDGEDQGHLGSRYIKVLALSR